MTEKEKRIIETFKRVLPSLSEFEKERLLAFGEGMMFKATQQNKCKHKGDNEHSLSA